MLKKFLPVTYSVFAGNVESDGMVHCVNDLGTVTAWSLDSARRKGKALTSSRKYQDFVLRVCRKRH